MIVKREKMDILMRMHELFRLKPYFNKYRNRVFAGVAALIVVDVLQLLIPRVLKRAIDGLALGQATLSTLIMCGGLIMAIALGVAFFRFFWRFFIIGSSRRIERELRTDLYNHITTLDLSSFDVIKTGDLMAHATNDINAVRMSIGFGLVVLTDIVILGCTALVMMLSINPALTLLALIPFPFITFISTRFGRMIHRRFEKVQELFSVIMERVRENLSGIRVVKIFAQEETEISRFYDLSNKYIRKNMELVRVFGLFFPAIFSLASIGEMIVLGAGGRYVILGRMSIGSFVAFIAYLQAMIWPMIAIGQAINMFQRGAASQGRINRIMDMRPTIQSGTTKLERVEGGIIYKGVTSRYSGKEEPALEDINFTIQPRDFVGITGPIGSGKSSLVNLLLRLYDFQEGVICIDGHDIRDVDRKQLLSNIAYVPQDTFLFSDTIKENIMFGRPEATVEEIEQSARISQIYDEIIKFPAGFETIVGERGVTLSGGQKQRIALARALLLDRPILILDDAISAVDAETERLILNGLRREIAHRTSIVISHRIFAIQDARLILVMDGGRIVESGRHADLIKNRGLYYDIYRTQQIAMRLETL